MGRLYNEKWRRSELSLQIKTETYLTGFPLRPLSVCKCIQTNEVLMGGKSILSNHRSFKPVKNKAASTDTDIPALIDCFQTCMRIPGALGHTWFVVTCINRLIFVLLADKIITCSVFTVTSFSCDAFLAYIGAHLNAYCSPGRASWIGCMWSAFPTPWWKSTLCLG